MGGQRRLLQAIDQIYQAALAPDVWTDISIQLKALLACDIACFIRQSTHSFEGALLGTSGQEQKFIDEFGEYYCALNPWTSKMSPFATGTLLLSDDYVANNELERTEFYCDFMRRQKMHYWSGTIVAFEQSNGILLTITRTKRAGQMSLKDLDKLEILIPHMQRAAQLHKRMAVQDLYNQALADSIDELPQAVILLDEHSRAIELNRAAHKIVDQKDGLSLDQTGRLSVNHGGVRVRLARMLSSAVRTAAGQGFDAGGMLPIPRVSQRQPYLLIATPLPSALRDSWCHPIPRVAVFLKDPEQSDGLPRSFFEDRWGFTPAETRVAERLLRGKDLTDIADTLQISMNTVRTHLKRILDKSETHRQAEFVALAYRCSAGLPTGFR